jgi:hypothetical protein
VRLKPVTIIYLVAMLVTFLLLGSLGPPALAAILVLLAADALRSTRIAIRSLVLIYIVRALNPGIVGVEQDLLLPGVVAVMVCCARICYDSYRRRAGIPHELWYLTAYVSVVILVSLFTSQFITVSLFKALFFYSVAASILLGCSTLADTRTEILGWLINCHAAVLIVSLPLLFNDLGYFRDGQGFQGILGHPQSYAIFLAPFAALLLCLVFQRGGAWALPWLIVVAISLVMTLSRTGIFAALAGAAIAFVAVRRSSPRSGARLRIAVLCSVIGCAAFVTAYMAPDQAMNTLETFVLKGRGEDLSESFEASRGLLIVEEMAHFLAHPLTGIGFGVTLSEIHVSIPIYEPITGLPISFPTEKANLVVAVLEETGILGFGFFLLFMWVYFRGVRRAGNVAVAAMAFAAIVTNVGEMTFFSMNSYGMLTWVLLALALGCWSSRVPHDVARRDGPVAEPADTVVTRPLPGPPVAGG